MGIGMGHGALGHWGIGVVGTWPFARQSHSSSSATQSMLPLANATCTACSLICGSPGRSSGRAAASSEPSPLWRGERWATRLRASRARCATDDHWNLGARLAGVAASVAASAGCTAAELNWPRPTGFFFFGDFLEDRLRPKSEDWLGIRGWGWGEDAGSVGSG